jgi:hypothetical protein
MTWHKHNVGTVYEYISKSLGIALPHSLEWTPDIGIIIFYIPAGVLAMPRITQMTFLHTMP